MSNYFNQTYSECRQKFLNALECTPWVEHTSYRVDEFSTDVAIYHGNDSKYLLHISGTHGPEGYAGSAIQLAMIQRIAKENLYNPKSSTNKKDLLPTLVIIHALNPYGFHHNRRVNEDNIDLNRNFLTEKDFNEVTSRDPNFAGYVNLDSFFNPTNKTFPFLWMNDIHSHLKSIYLICRYGITYVKRALVAGNYYKSTGLGYGGKELSASAKVLIGVINKLSLSTRAKQVIVIDVHTGLGPCGVDTLLTDIPHHPSFSSSSSSSLAPSSSSSSSHSTSLSPFHYIETIFPTEYKTYTTPPSYTNYYIIRYISQMISKIYMTILSLCGLTLTQQIIGGRKESVYDDDKGNSSHEAASTSSGYDLTRGTIMGDFNRYFLAPQLSFPDKITVTQEFGTVSIVKVGKAQMEENYAHHYGTEQDKLIYRQRLKEVFYVQTEVWKQQVIHRGLTVFQQALNYLSH